MKQLIVFTLVTLFFRGVCSQDNVPYSYDPPGNLEVDNVPLFVVMGFDDCMYPDGMAWTLDTLLNRKNPAGNNPFTFDGTPLYASFYINSVYADNPAAVDMWKKAYSLGHEIANHTHDHDEKLLSGVSQAEWYEEMKTCHEWIENNMGIPQNEIWGFRTPFLCQTSASFAAMDQIKFLYDCSVTHEPKDYDRIFIWPYTLDNGIGPGGSGNFGNHPGMWEIPVYNAALDPSGYPHMCGMDFSIWPRMVQKSDMVNVLKWSLDMRLGTGKNRAPLTIGMHPDLYSPSNTEQLVLGWPVKLNDRKASIVEFIDYALQKSMVRFVSARQLIEWMRKPVGLDEVTDNSAANNKAAIEQRFSVKRIHDNKLQLFIPKKGVYTVTLSMVNGRSIFSKQIIAMNGGTFEISLTNSHVSHGVFVVTCRDRDAVMGSEKFVR